MRTCPHHIFLEIIYDGDKFESQTCKIFQKLNLKYLFANFKLTKEN